MSKICREVLRLGVVLSILGCSLLLTNSAIAGEESAVKSAPVEKAQAKDQPISPQEQTHPETRESLTQVTSISQRSIWRLRADNQEAQQSSRSRNQIPKAAKKQSLRTLPPYSLKASDLRLERPSPVPDFSQYDFSTTKFSELTLQAVTEAPILLGGGTPIPAPTNEQPPTGESVAKNKSQYNLFNPTPRNLLREFSTDRPNLATSPLTVDAGHFYIEADIVNYTRKGSDEEGNTREKFLFASTTLRAGLTNNIEFRLLFQPYNLARTTFHGNGQVQQNTGLDILRGGSKTNTPTTSRRPGEVQQNAGLDTLQAGLKINIYGNDTYEKPGATAFGLLPFINIPTARNGLGGNSIEGGGSCSVHLQDK